MPVATACAAALEAFKQGAAVDVFVEACGELVAPSGPCMTEWQTYGAPSALAACAKEYCPRFSVAKPRACQADAGGADDLAWLELHTAILSARFDNAFTVPKRELAWYRTLGAAMTTDEQARLARVEPLAPSDATGVDGRELFLGRLARGLHGVAIQPRRVRVYPPPRRDP